jgi:hypothetical protein
LHFSQLLLVRCNKYIQFSNHISFGIIDDNIFQNMLHN